MNEASSQAGTIVQIASYNTNLQGNLGLPQDLVDWLQPTLSTTVNHTIPDIIAVGFQELLPLHLGFTGLSRAVVDSRNDLILKEIKVHTSAEYALVARSVNVGVALLLYAKDEGVARRIGDVQTTWTGCGPLWMGNKGAVGVRFTVRGQNEGDRDEVFTFVCAHLTAHAHNLAQRLHDYRHVVRTLLFPSPRVFSFSSSSTIYQTTHLFVFGDLNFRLIKDGSTAEEVRAKISSVEGRREIAARDELSLEMRKGTAFSGLREADFSAFPPTYKYLLGSTECYSEKRLPAWTDRILFATSSDEPEAPQESHITPLLYTSVPSYTTSDHKPVVALLRIPSLGPGALPPPVLASPPPHLRPALFPNLTRYTGKAVGWLVGWIWCLFYYVGMGRASLGIGNFVIGLSAWAWWRSGVRS